MKVVVTDTAWNDLLAIANYVALDSLEAAEALLDRLHAACIDLGQRPQAYPLVERYAQRGIRRRVVGSYLVCYRVRSDSVEVLHVLHGARDLDEVLADRD